MICCYLAASEINTDETRFLTDHVIAGSPAVARIAAETGCKHLVLTHFRRKSSALIDSIADDIRRIYGGELTVGTDLATVRLRRQPRD